MRSNGYIHVHITHIVRDKSMNGSNRSDTGVDLARAKSTATPAWLISSLIVKLISCKYAA